MRAPLILSLALLLVALVQAAAQTPEAPTPVPLEYYDAGYLKPGWRLDIRLHAVGMTAVPIPVSHAFADAGVQFAGHKYGIVGTDGAGPTVEVYYLVDGERVKIDTFRYGMKEYDAWVTITAYCPGERPAGAPGPAGDGQFWVKVELHGPYGSHTRWNLLQLEAGRVGVPLTFFYEKTPGLESWVSTENAGGFKDCGGAWGPDPGEGSDTRNDKPHESLTDWLEKHKWLLGLGAIVLILILLRGLLPW